MVTMELDVVDSDQVSKRVDGEGDPTEDCASNWALTKQTNRIRPDRNLSWKMRSIIVLVNKNLSASRLCRFCRSKGKICGNWKWKKNQTLLESRKSINTKVIQSTRRFFKKKLNNFFQNFYHKCKTLVFFFLFVCFVLFFWKWIIAKINLTSRKYLF